MPIKNYTLEELVNNPLFRSWVLSSKQEHNILWQEWLDQDIENIKIADEAAFLISNFQFIPKSISETELASDFAIIQQKIAKQRRRVIMKYISAAAIVGLIVVTSILFNSKAKATTRTTDYGQIMAVNLPDSSSIQLNANSTILYDDKWKKKQTRKVKLNGQALFEVAHQDNIPFEVELDDATIEVLGTTFDVIARTDKTRVVLEEGSIRLTFKDKQSVFTKSEQHVVNSIILQPNQAIEKTEEGWIVSQVNASQLRSWTTGSIVFDNTSVKDLIFLIENTFGYKVLVEDKTLLEETINGTIPTNDIKTLIAAIESILGINVKELNKKTITFEK